MNLNEAIQALTEARDQLGGDAPLLMADGRDVVEFQMFEDDHCIYVSDVGGLAPLMETEEEAARGEAIAQFIANNWNGGDC